MFFVGSLLVSLRCLIPELVELFVSPCATSCASEALRFIASEADVDFYGLLWILTDSFLFPVLYAIHWHTLVQSCSLGFLFIRRISMMTLGRVDMLPEVLPGVLHILIENLPAERANQM